MSGSGSGLLDPVFRGVELLFPRKADWLRFCAIVAPSLNGADLSFMKSVTGSACRAKCSNILHDRCNYSHTKNSLT